MAGTVTRAVKIAGQDFLLSFNAEMMIAAEKELNRGFFAILAGGLQSMNEQREIFRAALAPASEVTSEEASKLIDQAGPKVVLEWLVSGLNDYLGEPKVAAKTAPAKRAGAKA